MRSKRCQRRSGCSTRVRARRPPTGSSPASTCVPPGARLELPVAGRAGVSPTASSVVLNVTVDAAREDGFVTVHPCDTPRPNASNLNYRSGQTIPNTVVTRLGSGWHGLPVHVRRDASDRRRRGRPGAGRVQPVAGAAAVCSTRGRARRPPTGSSPASTCVPPGARWNCRSPAAPVCRRRRRRSC